MTGPDYSKLIYLSIVGGIAALLAVLALRNLLGLVRLAFGETSVGKVVGKRVDRDEGCFYYVTYSFSDRRGDAHRREIQVRKAAYESLAAGQDIAVVYEPGRPGNSYLREARYRRAHLAAACLTLLIAVGLGFVAFQFVSQCVVGDACPAGD